MLVLINKLLKIRHNGKLIFRKSLLHQNGLFEIVSDNLNGIYHFKLKIKFIETLAYLQLIIVFTII